MADKSDAPDTRTSDDPAAPRAKPLPLRLPLTADPPDLVPARMINEVLYCERLMYLEWAQGEFADHAFTVDGRAVHARTDVPAGALPPVPPAGPTEEEDDEAPEPPPYVARSILALVRSARHDGEARRGRRRRLGARHPHRVQARRRSRRARRGFPAGARADLRAGVAPARARLRMRPRRGVLRAVTAACAHRDRRGPGGDDARGGAAREGALGHGRPSAPFRP